MNGIDLGNNVVLCAIALGGFLGATAAIYRYLVRPIARTVTAVMSLVDEWRPVPHDLARVQADVAQLTALITTHLDQLAPAQPIRSRRRVS